MKKQDLPARWLERLVQYTDAKYGTDYKYRGSLGAGDFAGSSLVHVMFPDGSQSFFKFAFVIESPEWQEVAVLTEHCGYHVFPLVDTAVRLYEQKWVASGEEG
jgi:hypothetical protein